MCNPIFIFGCQRSGTSALGYALGQHPSLEYFPESDLRAYDDWLLRPSEIIKNLIQKHSQKICLFKPITESHKALDILDTYNGSKGVWIFRNPHYVINSMANEMTRSVEYIPEELERNLSILPKNDFNRFLLEIPITNNENRSEFENINISYLYWLVKNSLVFYFGLHNRLNVKLIHYSTLLKSKKRRYGLIRFLGLSNAECLDYLKPQGTYFMRYQACDFLVKQCEVLYEKLLNEVKKFNIA